MMKCLVSKLNLKYKTILNLLDSFFYSLDFAYDLHKIFINLIDKILSEIEVIK